MNDSIKVIAEFVDNASAGIKKTADVLKDFYGGLIDGAKAELQAIDANNKLGESLKKAEPPALSLGKSMLKLGAVIYGTKQIMDGFANSIKEADRMDKLSEQTGMAANEIRNLGFVAQLAGSSVDGITNAMERLGRSANMSEEDVKRQAGAFKQLGISATDTNGQIKDTDTLLMEMADAFAGIEDGPEKSAIAFRLLGSEAKVLLPLLSKGSEEIKRLKEEAQELGGTSPEQFNKFAKAAAAFNDDIDKLSLAFSGMFDQINSELVPVLVIMTNEIVDSAKEGGLLRAVIDGIVVVFNSGLVPVLKFAAIAINGFTSVVKIAAKGLGALGAAMVALLTGDFKGAAAIMSAYKDDVGQVAAEHVKFQEKMALAGHEAVKLAGSVDKPRRKLQALKKDAKEVTSELEKMLASLKITNESFGKDESEKLRLEAQAKYYKDVSVIGQKRAAELYAEVDAQIELNKTLRDAKEAQDAYVKAKESVQQMQATNAEIAFEVSLVGKNADERKKLIELRKEEIKLQEIQKGLTAEAAAKIAEEGAAAIAAREALIMAREDATITNEILDNAYGTILADVQRRLILATNLFESGKITIEDYTKYVDKQMERLKDKTKTDLTEMQEFWKAASEGIQQNLQSTIFDFMQGKLTNLGDAVKKTIDQIVSQMLAAKLATALFGSDTGKGNIGGFVGQGISWLSGLFGGARASGGPVEAGKAYMVGERGPEPFIPKTSGTILPNSVMGGSNQISISVSAIDSKDFMAKMNEVKRDVVEMLGSTKSKYRMA